jgi:hypothetical protein
MGWLLRIGLFLVGLVRLLKGNPEAKQKEIDRKAKAKWEKEETQLKEACDVAMAEYRAAVANGSPNHSVLFEHWRLCSEKLSSHRAYGQRKGFLD